MPTEKTVVKEWLETNGIEVIGPVDH